MGASGDGLSEQWKLTDLIDVQTLQSIQDAFARAFGLPTVIVDPDGRNATEITHRLPFCEDLTRTSPVGGPRCLMCDLGGMAQAAKTERPAIFNCWNGLYDCAIPIAPKGNVLGYFLCGQIFAEAPDPDRYRATARDIGTDPDEYVTALQGVRVLPLDQYKASVESMHFLAQMIADQAAAAIDNFKMLEDALRAKDDVSRLIEELDSILEAFVDIGSRSDYRSTLEAIADNLNKLIPYDSCLIYVADDKLDYLMPVVVRDPYPEPLKRFRPLKGEGLLGKVAATQIGRRIADASTEPDLHAIPGVPVEPEAMLVVPMVHRGTLQGVISLSRFKRRVFTEQEFRILNVVSSTQAALALENAHLHERERQMEDEFRVIADLATDLISATNQAEVIDRLLARAGEIFRSDTCCVARPERLAGEVELVSRSGRLEQRSTTNLSRTGRLAAVRLQHDALDRTAFDAWSEDIKRHLGRDREASIASVPLTAANLFLGGLFIGWREDVDHPEHIRRLMEIVAGMTTASLSNLVAREETDTTLRRRAAELQAVAARLESANRDTARRYDRLQQLLATYKISTVAVLEGDGLSSAIRRLSELLEAELIVFGVQGGVLARWPSTAAFEWADEAHEEPALMTLERDGRWLVAAPTVVEDEVLAWVVARLPSEAGEFQRTAVEYGALLTAVDLLRERTAIEVETRLRGGLVEELFSGELVDDRTLKQAMALGFDLTMSSRVNLVEPASGKGTRTDLESLYRAVTSAAGRWHTECLVALRGNSVVAIVHEIAEKENAFEDSVRETIERRVPQLPVNIAVGTPCAGLSDYRRSYLAARSGLDLLRMSNQSGELFTFRSAGIEQLLLQASEPQIILDFVSAYVEPLDRYDAKHSSSLRRSLETFYSEGLNLEASARRLHIHVSTLRYRLNKVQELLETDIRGPARLGIELALRAARVLNGG